MEVDRGLREANNYLICVKEAMLTFSLLDQLDVWRDVEMLCACPTFSAVARRISIKN